MADPFDLDTEVEEEIEDISLDEPEQDTGELEAGAPEDEGNEQDTLKAEVEALKRQQAEAQQAQLRAQEAALEAKRQAELDVREKDLLKQRREALENDDLESFDKLDEELVDIRLEKKLARVQDKRQAEDPESDLAPAAKDWINRNTWFRNGGAQADKVKKLAAELQSQYDVNDPALYEEIDRQLASKPKAVASAEPPKQKAGAVAGVNRGGGQPKKNGSKKLTRSDLQSMSKYGLDPNNQDHRRGWLRRNSPV